MLWSVTDIQNETKAPEHGGSWRGAEEVINTHPWARYTAVWALGPGFTTHTSHRTSKAWPLVLEQTKESRGVDTNMILFKMSAYQSRVCPTQRFVQIARWFGTVFAKQ